MADQSGSVYGLTILSPILEQLSKVLQNLLGVDKVQFCHQVPCPPGTWFIDLALAVSPNGAIIVSTTWDPNLSAPFNVEAFRAVVPIAQ